MLPRCAGLTSKGIQVILYYQSEAAKEARSVRRCDDAVDWQPKER